MDLEEQKETWRKEQLIVASQVEILPDEPPIGNSKDRFQQLPLLSLNNVDHDGEKYYYGGVDVSFPTNEKDPSVAVYVILEFPSGTVVYQDSEYYHLTMPYIPSYLAFREIEPLERLIQKQLVTQPELTPRAILVDGNGVLHPRKAGIACFVGVRTGLPTIGVGKTLFYEGQLNKDLVLRELEESLQDAKESFVASDTPQQSRKDDIVIVDSRSIPKQNATASQTQNSPPLDRGGLVKELSSVCRGVAVPLSNEEGEVLACALVGHGGRIGSKAQKAEPLVGTKNPIYVSVGHKISLQESVQLCASLSFAKIPEPVRQADLIGRELLRSKELKEDN